ncbi:MAG TPA: EamA family transporter RarD, partial [Rectinemataceae bacterium]|nr:EamA family transporter RarD [Rectinemataceae bacterium]
MRKDPSKSESRTRAPSSPERDSPKARESRTSGDHPSSERDSPKASESRESGGARAARLGTLAAFAAYGMWGLFPLYWKRLATVDPLQILAHRIVWAAVFTVALLAFSRRLRGLALVLRNPRRLAALAASAGLVTMNWGIYIWAVNSNHVTESSLGYYINPLLSVALGALFLGERLDLWTRLAVGIASLGVAAASIMLGGPPWISLALAASFALYGYVKKRVGLDPMTGLAAETLIAAPFALAFLIFAHASGRGSFGGS